MDAIERMGGNEAKLRSHLEQLDWGRGLTTAEIASQLRGTPTELFGDLADGAIFHGADEVIRALKGEIDLDVADMPAEGMESLGGPAGYGPSTTGALVMRPSTSGGIGSGTDTGDTGSGDTEATGWGRPGTTFGEEAVEEAAEDEA